MKTFKLLLASAFLFLITFSSCKKDPCENVNCQNGGTCNNGTCDCPANYEGTNCQTPAREKFLGSYYGTNDCELPPNTYNISLTGGSNINEIIMVNLSNAFFNATGTLVSDTSINFPPQAGSGNGQVSGTATLNGNILTTVFTHTYESFSFTCTATFTKM